MKSDHVSSMPLFDENPARGSAPVIPAIPLNSTVESWDTQRLNDQHHAILAALQGGPKTNLQLGMICQRFGARLHELKRAGHPWTKATLKAGVVEYRLLDRGEQ